ncbi:efflux RND transporter periplasmic adaptor subunit [Namhaeicola litoreus]|uniref:Efflux RND transporter periplasmic adaptor subunit n=1 Tax=Namhaeicola litoreus TaxID=1052145 RepID=A0ABW3Y224_9FLAO
MKKIIILLIAVISAYSCGDSKNEVVVDNTIVNVSVAKPNSNASGQFFTASGQIEADQFSNLSTKITGYIENIYVKIGDKVTKGQLLLKINNTDIEAQRAQVKAKLLQAEANFKIAENNYNRFKKLYEQKSASTKEFEDVQAAYDIASAQVEAVKEMENEVSAMLNYSSITAPFSGVITDVFVKEGNMALPGNPLLGIENPNNLVATAEIPEMYLTKVNKGDQVKVRIKSNQTLLNGKVREISRSSQNSGGQYLAKVEIPNTEEGIFSGMDVTTEFPFEGTSGERITIPKSILIHKGQLSGIYTLSQSNTAVLRWLRLGKEYGDQIEVLSGLSADEAYIMEADGKLYNGVKIQIK